MTKKTKEIVGVVALWGFLAALLLATGTMVYKGSIAPCVPCGYVDYEKKVQDGYEPQFMGFCMPCSDAANPDRWLRNMSHQRALKGCPPIYTDQYNKTAKELNAQLTRKGFEPRYEIIDEKK
jgi:hypothetical protein